MPMYKPTQIELAESAPGHYMHTRDLRPEGGVSQVHDAEMSHFATCAWLCQGLYVVTVAVLNQVKDSEHRRARNKANTSFLLLTTLYSDLIIDGCPYSTRTQSVAGRRCILVQKVSLL